MRELGSITFHVSRFTHQEYPMTVTIGEATPADIEECGRIIYEAFRSIAERHNFPPDFPSAEAGVRTARFCINHPAIYGVVAEREGRVLGSSFIDERDPVRGVGPVTVDPAAQERGVGRRMMQALLERGRNAVGVRLVQDAFNTVSMPLYASLGFEVKEPLVLLEGRPSSGPPAGIAMRPLTVDDLDACEALCRRVHGFERTGELGDALSMRAGSSLVAVRDGRITAYASSVSMRGHGVAATDEDLTALLCGAARAGKEDEPLMFLLPTRQAGLFRWCLREGFRVVKPMTLMSMGAYQQPRGGWFPSVSY
jgi:predicted N-acetyltransferase YhbS